MGCGEVVWWDVEDFLEGKETVMMVWGGFLEWWGDCLEDVERLSGGCGEAVWRVWGSCLE